MCKKCGASRWKWFESSRIPLTTVLLCGLCTVLLLVWRYIFCRFLSSSNTLARKTVIDWNIVTRLHERGMCLDAVCKHNVGKNYWSCQNFWNHRFTTSFLCIIELNLSIKLTLILTTQEHTYLVIERFLLKFPLAAYRNHQHHLIVGV